MSKDNTPARYRHMLALAFFVGVAAWLTWPQAAFLGRAIVGGALARSDGWQNVWNLWWIRRALLAGQNPLATDLLYWPEGVQLALQTLNPTSALLTLPVLLAAGPVAAYGVAVLLGFALSGWFTYLLALRVSGSWEGALIGGLLVEAAPQHLGRFLDGQLEHISLQWVPLYLLALLSASERPTRRAGLWLGASVALVAYTSWYHALSIALLTLIWLGWQLLAIVRQRGPHIPRQLWDLVRPWLVALPLLLLLLLPVIPGLLAGLADSSRPPEHWYRQAWFHSIDLLDLFLPSAYHPLWGPAVAAYQQPLHPNSVGWVVTPGYAALALIIAGLLFRWRAARLWALLAAVLLLFALGTRLRVAGVDSGLPLPIAPIIARLPGLGLMVRRSLAVLVALVPLAVVAAYGVQALLERLRGLPPLVPGGLFVALLLLEAAPPPVQVLYDDTPPVYAALKGQPGTLLVLPVNPQEPDIKSAPLRAQMTHGRPIMGGYVARDPDYPLARGAPLMGDLARRTCQAPDIVAHDADTTLSALAYYNVSQIVLQTDWLSADQVACARQLLEALPGLVRTQQEGPVLVYAMPAATAKPFLFLGDGWHRPEQDGPRIWRWMTAKGELYLVHTDRVHIGTFAVNLRMESLEIERPVSISLNQQPAGTFAVTPHRSRVYHLLIPASPGQNELRLNAPTSRDPNPQTPRDMSIAVESVTIEQLR